MKNKTVKKVIFNLFWIIVWQLAAMGVNKALLIPVPTPAGTALAMLRLFEKAEFWASAGLSVIRILLGFGAAMIIGTLCGVLSARHEFFGNLMAPVLSFIRAIPVAALTIILFLWVKRDMIPSVIAFVTVLPIVWGNVESGILSLNRGLIEMARVFGMGRGVIFKEITVPGIKPFLVSSFASGMGFAWKSGCAAEIICRTANSLGNLLWSSKSTVDYDEVFAVAFVIIFLSTVFQTLSKRLVKKGAGNDKV